MRYMWLPINLDLDNDWSHVVKFHAAVGGPPVSPDITVDSIGFSQPLLRGGTRVIFLHRYFMKHPCIFGHQSVLSVQTQDVRSESADRLVVLEFWSCRYNAFETGWKSPNLHKALGMCDASFDYTLGDIEA